MLIGREAELTHVEGLLDRIDEGAVGLALEGEPGVGKSALWRAGVAVARERGLLVLSAAPNEPDLSLAFAGLGDVLDGIPPTAIAGLSSGQRRALDAALGVADNAAELHPAAADILPRTVLRIVRGLAAATPVLVAIDDEQWLDRPSARVLGFVMRRLAGARIGVLLARRPASNGALWAELSRGFGSEGLETLSVGALDLPSVRQLLAARLSGRLSSALVRRIHEASGGNPLYALSIARELAGVDPSERAGRLMRIPPSIGEAMERRLGGLPPRTAHPLLVAAAAPDASLALIAAAVPGFRPSDLDEAERADIVVIHDDRVSFTHPLLRSARYALAASGERRELHRRLAELVTDDVERARHLSLGTIDGDATAADSIAAAANVAAARGAPEVAAELLESAVRLTPPGRSELRTSRVTEAAAQHRIADDLPRARRLLEEALEHAAAGGPRARVLLELALLRTDDFAAAQRFLREALDHAGEDDRLAAEAEAARAELYANGGEHGAAVAHGEAAIRHAERSGDRSLLATALATHGVAAFFHGDGVQTELMDRARELEPHATGTSYGMPTTSLGLQLLWSDQPEAARPLLYASLRRAEERGEDRDYSGLTFHIAHLEWEAGNTEEAERLSHRVASMAAFAADTQFDSYAAWLRAYRAARTGDLATAHAAAHDAIRIATDNGDQFIVSFATAILAAVDLWRGRPEEAHERIAPLRDPYTSGGFIGSLTIPIWSCDAEALAALGRISEAHAVADALARRAVQADNPHAAAVAHRCRGAALAAGGDVPAAIAELDKALAAHRRRELPLEVARTWLEKGSLERRARRKSAAKHSLEQALRGLEPLRASMWAARARDELSRVGLRRGPARSGLTAAEQRVAELAANGLTTRQIADTLYMSSRTVETHLTRIYREFGVSSRAQIALALQGGDGAKAADGPA